MTTLVDLELKADATSIDKATESLKKNAEAAKTVEKQNSTLSAETKKTNGGFMDLANSANKLTGSTIDVDGAMSKLSGGGLSLAVAGVTAIVGAAALAYHALSELRDQSIEAADKMNDLANRTNIATTRLSLLDFMAKQAGSGVQELVDSSERLAMKIARQDETTGKLVTALKTLHVSTKDANGETKSMLKLQEDVVMAAENATNKTKAEGAAVQILGTEYYKLRNVIKEAAESKGVMYDKMAKTNALISGELAKNSDAYKDKVGELKLAFTGIGNSIAEATLPFMIKFQSKMVEIAEYAADVIRRFAGLSTASEQTGEALGKLIVERDNLTKSIAKSEGTAYADTGQGAKFLSDAKARVTAINDQIREMSRLKTGADAAADAVKKATTDGKGGEGARVSGKTSTPDDPTKSDAYKDAMRIAQDRQNARQKEQDEIERYFITTKTASLEADHRMIVSQEKLVASVQQEMEEYKIASKVMQKYGATTNDITLAIDDYRISLTEKNLAEAKGAGATEDQIGRLERQLEVQKKLRDVNKQKKDVDDGEYNRQRTFGYGWEQAFRKYEEDASNASKNAEQLFSTASKGMEDALTKFAMTGKLSFKDLANSIIADLIRMQAKAAVTGIFKMIIGSFGGGFGGAMGDAAAAGIGGGGKAGGGPVAGDGSVLVGEKGPELFVPHGAGTIIPNHALSTSGGGSTQTNNISITVNGGLTNEETAAVIQKSMVDTVDTMKKIADGRIANSRRPGGLLYA